MKQEGLAQCVRLHFREMLEPTGLWAEEVDDGMSPAHDAFVAVLSRYPEIKKAGDDVQRRTFSIAGRALQIFICRDVIDAIRPRLPTAPATVNRWAMRFTDYVVAMVAVQAVRRTATTAPSGHLPGKS